MIRITPYSVEGTPAFRLEGILDENVEIVRELTAAGLTPGDALLHLGGVRKVNSPGVRNWLVAMDELTKTHRLRFLECSPAVVECLNIVPNFLGGGSSGQRAQIESILLPYICESCRKESLSMVRIPDLAGKTAEPPAVPCPHCRNGKAAFDDLPELYFEFLKRTVKS
jgi:hypothetical protein